MARLIAVCNQKGGVGKTTTVVNLAACLAALGSRILLVDLDPQANATGGLGFDKKNLPGSIYESLLTGSAIDEIILSTQVANLWVAPSHISLSGAELELVPMERRDGRLKQVLEPVRESYDFILIDCPPSLGLLTINAMTAADSVLIPLQCEYYALEGLSQLLDTIRMVRQSLNPALSIEGILLTMADFRTKLTSDVIAEVRRFFGPQVYEVVVPRSVRLGEAPSHGTPISIYDPCSPGAKAYEALAKRIRGDRRPTIKEEKSDDPNARVGQGDQSADPRGEPSAQGGAVEGSPAGHTDEPVSAP